MARRHVLTAVLTPDPDGGYVAQVAELYLEDATAEELAALDAHPVTATVEVSVG
jgi:predicted RNase H-like HicB family nuclease